MNILLSPHAARQFKKFPRSLQKLLHNTIAKLQFTPYPPGYKKLSGHDGYRIRYGDYRIIYKIDPPSDIIMIQAIAHRREVYKN